MDKSEFERIKREEQQTNSAVTGPMAYFNKVLNKEVTIVRKDKTEIKAILKAFDLYLNLTIEVDGSEQFISGKSVMYVCTE